MARNGVKTGGKNFEPGCAPGPGRPAIPYEEKMALKRIKEMRGVANLAFQERFAKYASTPIGELIKLQQDQTLSAEDTIIVKALIHIANRPYMSSIAVMKTLATGPEPKQVQLSGLDGEPLSPFQGATVADLLAAYQELQKKIKGPEKCKSTAKQQQQSESRPASSARSSRPARPTE